MKNLVVNKTVYKLTQLVLINVWLGNRKLSMLSYSWNCAEQEFASNFLLADKAWDSGAIHIFFGKK